jgi:hypothetical protein
MLVLRARKLSTIRYTCEGIGRYYLLYSMVDSSMNRMIDSHYAIKYRVKYSTRPIRLRMYHTNTTSSCRAPACSQTSTCILTSAARLAVPSPFLTISSAHTIASS